MLKHLSVLLHIAFVVILVGVIFAPIALSQEPADKPAEVNWVMVILGFLLAVSEVLALIPSVASSSVFTLIVNLLRGIVGKPPIAIATPPGAKIIGGK